MTNKPTTGANAVQSMLAMVRRYPGTLAVSVVLLLAASLFQGIGISLLLPLLVTMTGNHEQAQDVPLQEVITSVFDWFGYSPELGSLLLLVFLVVLTAATVKLISMVQIAYGMARTAADQRERVMRSVLASRWRYASQVSSGRVATELSTESESASGMYAVLGKMVSSLLELSVQFAVAVLISLPVALGGIVFGAFMGLLFARLLKMTRTTADARREAQESMVSRVLETMSMFKSLKAMGMENSMLPILEKEINGVRRTMAKLQSLTAVFATMPEPIAAGFLAAGLYVYVTALGGSLEPILVLALLFMRMATSVRILQSSYQSMLRHVPSFRLMEEFIVQSRKEAESITGRYAPEFEQGLSLRDASVDFGATNHPALNGVTLEIENSGFYAVLGPTGAGKSTLVNLIAGLEQPDSGTVLVDGKPLTEFDIEQWRSKIGYVPQEITLLADSVAANVSMQAHDYDADAVQRALSAAGAWEFVAKLPEGIFSSVGERGSKLSGGQRQRIALARALYRNPSLLILDEATAGLDQATEDEILKQLRLLSETITIIAISHNPSILRYADHCIEVLDGRAHLATPRLDRVREGS